MKTTSEIRAPPLIRTLLAVRLVSTMGGSNIVYTVSHNIAIILCLYLLIYIPISYMTAMLLYIHISIVDFGWFAGAFLSCDG